MNQIQAARKMIPLYLKIKLSSYFLNNFPLAFQKGEGMEYMKSTSIHDVLYLTNETSKNSEELIFDSMFYPILLHYFSSVKNFIEFAQEKFMLKKAWLCFEVEPTSLEINLFSSDDFNSLQTEQNLFLILRRYSNFSATDLLSLIDWDYVYSNYNRLIKSF